MKNNNMKNNNMDNNDNKNDNKLQIVKYIEQNYQINHNLNFADINNDYNKINKIGFNFDPSDYQYTKRQSILDFYDTSKITDAVKRKERESEINDFNRMLKFSLSQPSKQDPNGLYVHAQYIGLDWYDKYLSCLNFSS